MKKERNIGLDLLRILLAIAVIIVHFNAEETGRVASSVHWLPMKFLVYGMNSVVTPAVNIYVIMSGYFAYLYMKSYKQVVSSLVKLWFCLVFFSVGGAVFVSFLSTGSVSFLIVVKRLFPLITGEWWYMSVYFATLLISPFMNKAVNSFGKSDSFLFLGAMLLVCSILPFFTKFNEPLGVNLGYSFIWFILLYYTGAVICKYFNYIQSKWYLLSYFGLALINVMVGYIASKIEILAGYGLSTYNSIILYLQAIFCFLWFKNLTIKNFRLNKIITYLSGLSLASYIFHCQTDIGSMIWRELSPSQYADNIKLIPVFIITVLGIYIVSILIEIFRRKLVSIGGFEKIIINQITNSIHNVWKSFYRPFK